MIIKGKVVLYVPKDIKYKDISQGLIYNINARNGYGSFDLATAIKNIPFNERRKGIIISFLTGKVTSSNTEPLPNEYKRYHEVWNGIPS